MGHRAFQRFYFALSERERSGKNLRNSEARDQVRDIPKLFGYIRQFSTLRHSGD